MNEDEIIQKIGAKLRELRLAKGYTSHEIFAYEHGLGRVQYWRLEAGKANMTIKTLVGILNIHGITLEEFFKGL